MTANTLSGPASPCHDSRQEVFVLFVLVVFIVRLMRAIGSHEDMAADNTLRVCSTLKLPILSQKLAFGPFSIMSQLFEHLRLSILLAILLRVDDHVHPVALFTYSASRNKIGAEWIILWKVCSEVHFFPLEFFAQVLFARKSKLSQVPPLDEVNFAICRGIIDFVRVRLVA